MSDSESSFAEDEIINEEIGQLPETEDLQELENKFSKLKIKKISIRKELVKIVQDFVDKEVLPNVVEMLIVNRKLNIMVLDLYDYNKGYAISFHKFGKDEEIFHGEYSYAVSLIEYIKDGEIPYEVFDKLCKYNFQIVYEGYVFCKLRINFGLEDNMRSHFVLLKHTMQTIDAECHMKCNVDSSLNFEVERARLIKRYSPELCLDPDPIVAEIVIANELSRHPFITPYLRDIILNEKARREKGVLEMMKPQPPEYASRNLNINKQEDWSFRVEVSADEDDELAKAGSGLEYTDSLATYLKGRLICFPDEKSFTGFPVEIENFVYEYEKDTSTEDFEGDIEKVADKLCIAVLDNKEYYYGAYRLGERMKKKRMRPSNWWKIGGRKELDKCVDAFTSEQMKLTCCGMKITHNRIFGEQAIYMNGTTQIMREKLLDPESEVVLHISQPSYEEDVDEKMEEE